MIETHATLPIDLNADICSIVVSSVVSRNTNGGMISKASGTQLGLRLESNDHDNPALQSLH